MSVLVRTALAAAGAAGVAVGVWSVRPGWSWGAAAAAEARHELLRLLRAAAAALGVLTGAAGVVQKVTGHRSAFEPFVPVAVCGIAVLTVRPASAATDSGVAGLVVGLGTTTDALSLQSRLARAVSDRDCTRCTS